MVIYAIRHPQTEWHIQKRVQGHKDSQLTGFGKKTAMRLGMSLKDKDITKIFSSDLGRCFQTANIIAKILKLPIEYAHELRERNFGQFNGRKYKYVKEHLDLNNPDLIAPGGENFNGMKLRVIQYVKKIYDNNKKDTILLVTHEGCIRALLSYFYECNFTDSKCDSSQNSIYKFLIDRDKFRLVDIIN